MASQSVQSSNPTSGQPSRPYGAFMPNNNGPSNGSSRTLSSHRHRFAAPGLTSLRPSPFQGQTPTVASRALAICFAIMLLQAVLIIHRSETLAKFIGLESTALRASAEKLLLMMERGESEWEREKMRYDRESWEKVLDRVPEGAYWDNMWDSWDCRGYGKREYWGTLLNISEGWSEVDACMNTPVEIEGVTVRHPHRCLFVGGSIRGYWMVDWGQPDCETWLLNFRDRGCIGYRSGTRQIDAVVVGIQINIPDWRLMCESTPLTWNHINYTSPARCEDHFDRKVAVWYVPDESCL